MNRSDHAPPPPPREKRRFGLFALVALAAVAALVVVGVAALLTSIFERRQEARNPFYRVVELTDTTQDPQVWGKNFPHHYDTYLRTVDQTRTRYGGSEALPRLPTPEDPRDVVAQSRLEEDPRLRELWAGYAFAADFREERGHAYMLEDQLFTQRQNVAAQPGTCLHCHASVYVPYKRAGDGNLIRGFERLNTLPYREARQWVTHPITCIDCHDPGTMQLRVTRPAFMEAMARIQPQVGGRPFDVNRDPSRQEMRTYVCAQCHVEYYFAGAEKRLTYPWDRGLTADSILAYYEANGHADWTHAASGARVLKAQHPEFEMYSQGIHARSGVACADCHMPYQRVGAMKISNHQVRSPLLSIDKSCQTCHRWSEEELRQRVHTIQDRTYELRSIALDAVLDLTRGIGSGSAASPAAADAARGYQRKAQFLLDFVEAENSMGFHADQEAARVLGLSINYSRLGQAALRGEPVSTARRAAPPPQLVTPRPSGAEH